MATQEDKEEKERKWPGEDTVGKRTESRRVGTGIRSSSFVIAKLTLRL